jgi:hypothetical protein
MRHHATRRAFIGQWNRETLLFKPRGKINVAERMAGTSVCKINVAERMVGTSVRRVSEPVEFRASGSREEIFWKCRSCAEDSRDRYAVEADGDLKRSSEGIEVFAWWVSHSDMMR